ncbi:hypothetical protein [Streptomyces spiralis]|uniref:hypothetical protein n=1 Tax=Streptomyces spiralis TaxID=66376 RepID=UPI003695A4A0
MDARLLLCRSPRVLLGVLGGRLGVQGSQGGGTFGGGTFGGGTFGGGRLGVQGSQGGGTFGGGTFGGGRLGVQGSQGGGTFGVQGPGSQFVCVSGAGTPFGQFGVFTPAWQALLGATSADIVAVGAVV